MVGAERAKEPVLLIEPSPDGQRMPPGWRPPAPFRIVVHYSTAATSTAARPRDRPSDDLWVVPFLLEPDGRVIYLAAGPAGEPIADHLVRDVDVPRTALVSLSVEHDAAGRQVYATPHHTAN